MRILSVHLILFRDGGKYDTHQKDFGCRNMVEKFGRQVESICGVRISVHGNYSVRLKLFTVVTHYLFTSICTHLTEGPLPVTECTDVRSIYGLRIIYSVLPTPYLQCTVALGTSELAKPYESLKL